MLNIELIKEITFKASGQPELFEALLKYKPSLRNVENNQLKKTYFHVIYLDTKSGPKVVFHRGNNMPIAIPKTDFKTRLASLSSINFDEVCFMLATYGDDEIPDINNRIVTGILPKKLEEILKPTRGYLLYDEQGIELYRLLVKDDWQKGSKWLDDVKKLNKDGKKQYLAMKLNGQPFSNFEELFLDPEYAPSFRPKPVNETYDILQLISKDYQIVASYETWMHLRQDGLYLADGENDLFLEDQLIKSTLKLDGLGNYRIAFLLRNEILDFDQEIELGLNYNYGTSNNISGLTGWFIQPNENQFILDFTAIIEVPDKSDYYSISMKANFNFTLPKELKVNKMVYKLYQ